VSRNTPPPRDGHAEGLFSLVFLLIGFRLLITAFQELRCLIKRGFEHAKHLPVSPYQSTVRIAALVLCQQPFMVADIRKEQGGQDCTVRDVAARG
jgi:hypothetical protein